MRYLLIFSVTLLFSFVLAQAFAQNPYPFEPTLEHPYGLPNINMPEQMMDFAPLIGVSRCRSVKRIDKDNWTDTLSMTWTFKYIMNGLGIQDETLHEDGSHAGSIRQYIPDSARWYTHYYSSSAPTSRLPTWEGNKNKEEDIILYQDQKAPNGIDGRYKITFSNISSEGFDWAGEWVTMDESIIYPTWYISCNKDRPDNYEQDKKEIADVSAAFSRAYERGDHAFMADAYTSDGKLLPGWSDIIEGREPIDTFWTLKEGTTILSHKATPEELTIIGDYAYDYGFYEGESKREGEVKYFKGKYVIIWKRTSDGWKMYLDIWN